MDIAGFYIFINLLINYIKNDFVKYKQFILIFPLVRTAILFAIFFHIIKNKIFFFNNIIGDYSQKWEIKNQKQKIITTPIKKNYKKDCESITEIFLKMRN